MAIPFADLCRLGTLVILISLLQASPGNTLWWRRRRSKPPPALQCTPSEWSSWTECNPFCDLSPKRTRHRTVKKGNKCEKETTEQPCAASGCAQYCDSKERKCTCMSGFTLDSSGKNCMDKDECRVNGGRGPCSHACQNIYGDYTCTCEKGYRVHGRTQCVILDCGTPNFSSCPPEDNKKTWSMSNEDLPLCKAVIFSCPNGTKYNAQCSLSCPLNYGLALKDPNQSWNHYQAFDFRTPSNRIMCQVELETSVFWHTQLSRYYCRRKNDPPLSIQLNNTVIDEKLPPGTLVGRLNAVDAQYNQKMVYSVHSLRGKPLFRCHGPILESSVIFKWKPNAENSYPVRIRAQDDGSPRMWIEQVFNITLLNVNDPPRSIEISKNSVYENSSIGTIVGTLTAIDDDFSQQRSSNFSWKLLTNNSGNFNVSGADVVVTKRLNYDLFRVHYITVACGDSIAFSERVLLIYVINSIDPPTLRLTGHKIPENSKIGAVVGQIEAKSERRGDMVFNLSPSGPAVQTKFVLSPSPICIHHQNAIKFNSTCFVNLTVSGHLDFEEQSEYVVQVFVKNKQSSNFKKWNLTIENVNEKPDKLDFNGMMSIPEATKSGVDFCFLLVSDPDNKNTPSQRHSCRVVNQRGDGQYFQVNDITNALQVKTNKTLNYERQSTYLVTVKCTDNGDPPLSIAQNITINVTDTDEPIQNITLSNNQIRENATVGTIVGILDAYDPDVHRPKNVNFSIVDPEDCPFQLKGANNHLLVLNRTVNFEETPTLVVTIRVTDSAGSCLQWPFRINILDVHEPPTDIQLNSNIIKENLEEGSPISNITVVDEDENTLVSCKILQDGKGRVSVNGTVLIAGKTAVDYEMEPSHILMISLKCCDQFKLCLKKNFSMEIKDVNEPPSDIIIDNSEVLENQKDVLIGNITVLDPDKNQEYFCIVLDEKTENEYLRIRNNMQGQTTLYLIRELNFERDSFLSFNITCKEQVNVSTYSITKTFALNVIDVNEAPTKGCLNPFFVSPEQSPGTILGYLNVTDPDNEIYKVTDQDTCQQKQQLKYAIVSEKEDIVPFEVTDGYLVKTGKIQGNSMYRVLISVQDDGVVSTMSSVRPSYNKMTVTFNCTVITTARLEPRIKLSANQIDENSKNGTIIGYLNTTTPSDVNGSHPGNVTYTYRLGKERCNNYPFDIIGNMLTLTFYEQSRREMDESEIPNYVIIQVSSSSSDWPSNTIHARFVILIKGDKVHSWMCFTNQSIQRSKVLDTKLGRIRIYQSSKNDSIQECPENKDDKDLSVHGNYICDAKPSFNSSANVKKTDLNNYIYVDREMFLRINTSLDYGDVSQDKLLVQVKCWDSAKPLHIVTGKLTVHLRDNRTNDIITCQKKPCKEGETCVSLVDNGYDCKPAENICEDRNHERDETLCSKTTQCPQNSLCSKFVNITQRCINNYSQLFIGLLFLLRENLYCKFENCLKEILGNQTTNCLEDIEKESSGHRRRRRATTKSYVEILNVRLSQGISLVQTAVWTSENGELQLQEPSSFLSVLRNTKRVVFVKSSQDCSIFRPTEIKCPIKPEDLTKAHSEGLLESTKYQAALGIGTAIILIVIVISMVYFLKKRRKKQREMTQHQSVSHELGYFNNSAFDGVETREAEIANQMVRIYENDVEKEDRHQKKKKKHKKGKAKPDFKNPVYEEPRILNPSQVRPQGIYGESDLKNFLYSEPQVTKEKSLIGVESISNPFYAASDRILVEKPLQAAEKSQMSISFEDQSQILEREQGNNINQDKQSVATNKYPLYEELPRVNDSEKQQKGPFEKDKPERVKVENNDKNVPNQSFHHSDETKKDRKDMENSSPYYHVLESDEKADGQGDISKRKDNEDENTSNETTSPHYFVLEKNGTKEKPYQSLHRELESPPPEYEVYRTPEKLGEPKDNQAEMARVYEEPFLMVPNPHAPHDEIP